jgi:exodeoxyribonuclease V alpha subunit
VQLETVQGILESITYQSDDSGFMVGKLSSEPKEQLIVFRGSVYSVSIGETLKLEGYWTNHKTYGHQFHVSQFTCVEPTTTKGILRYLASDRFHSIGEKTAQQIVKKFGTETLSIIDHNPEKILKLSLVSESKLEVITSTRQIHREEGDTYVFLHALQLPPSLIQKIYEAYGLEAADIIQDNPYRLAQEIKGIGFRVSDALAEKRDIPKNSPLRAKAALLFYMDQLSNEGHTCYLKEALIQYTASQLEKLDKAPLMGIEVIADVLEHLLLEGEFKEEEQGDVVFLKRNYFQEVAVTERIKKIKQYSNLLSVKNQDKLLEQLENSTGMILHEQQKQAVVQSIEEKIFVITGGPGTGKTTIIQFILELLRDELPKIHLAAPTGKAAKRMAESTKMEVKTIHRLLEISGNGVGRDKDKPLESDLLIVDECSMIDLSLFNLLLDAIPDSCKLILVGDVDQLPSIRAGAILRDLLDSEKIAHVRLNKIFRQSSTSQITTNAHNIIHGKFFEEDLKNSDDLKDFYFIDIPRFLSNGNGRYETDYERIINNLFILFDQKIPERFQVEQKDIQILTAVRQGSLGTELLNERIQEKLFKDKEAITINKQKFYVGDRVMQTKNNYELDVFNGDQGFLLSGNKESLIVDYDGRQVQYSAEEARNLTVSWATTIHKSQGSEFPVVIILLTTSHSIMLYRNLLYTAVTRGKKLVVVIGEKYAVEKAIQTQRGVQRQTWLKQRIQKLRI